jgi:hypothetical protein
MKLSIVALALLVPTFALAGCQLDVGEDAIAETCERAVREIEVRGFEIDLDAERCQAVGAPAAECVLGCVDGLEMAPRTGNPLSKVAKAAPTLPERAGLEQTEACLRRCAEEIESAAAETE